MEICSPTEPEPHAEAQVQHAATLLLAACGHQRWPEAQQLLDSIRRWTTTATATVDDANSTVHAADGSNPATPAGGGNTSLTEMEGGAPMPAPAAMQDSCGPATASDEEGGELMMLAVNIRDPQGATPLLLAARHGNASLAAQLLACGAQHDCCIQPSSNTPLHLAALNGHTDVLKVLLDSGAPADVHNSACDTPLMHACKAGHLGAVARLIKAGARASAANADGLTPLMVAASSGQHLVVQAIIRTARTAQEGTVHTAADTAHTAAGADGSGSLQAVLDAQDHQGCNTALHFAARAGASEVVRALVEAGAGVDVRNRAGRTALGEAQLAHSPQCIALLTASLAPAGGSEQPLAATPGDGPSPKGQARQEGQARQGKEGRQQKKAPGHNKQQAQPQPADQPSPQEAQPQPDLAPPQGAQQVPDQETTDVDKGPDLDIIQGTVVPEEATPRSLQAAAPAPLQHGSGTQHHHATDAHGPVPHASHGPHDSCQAPQQQATALQEPSLPPDVINPPLDQPAAPWTTVVKRLPGRGRGAPRDNAAGKAEPHPGPLPGRGTAAASRNKVAQGPGQDVAPAAATARPEPQGSPANPPPGVPTLPTAAWARPGHQGAPAAHILGVPVSVLPAGAGITSTTPSPAVAAVTSTPPSVPEPPPPSSTPSPTCDPVQPPMPSEPGLPAAVMSPEASWQGAGVSREEEWIAEARTYLQEHHPDAALLEVGPQHVLGLEVSSLSFSQLEALEAVHHALLARVVDARLVLVRDQERTKVLEATRLRLEIQARRGNRERQVPA